MKSKKEQELLRELFPILIKYDLKTIEGCVDYIQDNKQQLRDCLIFVNGEKQEPSRDRTKSAIDEMLVSTERNKSMVIKRVYKYLSGKNFTFEQIDGLFKPYMAELKTAPLHTVSEEKEGLILEIMRYLLTLDLSEIETFERYIQVNRSIENKNTLENWSKVIVEKRA